MARPDHTCHDPAAGHAAYRDPVRRHRVLPERLAPGVLFPSRQAARQNGTLLFHATAATGFVGPGLLVAIRYPVSHNAPDFGIEHLFDNARRMAASLAAAGVLILVSSRAPSDPARTSNTSHCVVIGAVQGLRLPLRGFSRSGATISTGRVPGVARRRAGEFCFTLAVVPIPVVILKELYRLYRHASLGTSLSTTDFLHLLTRA